MLIGTAGHIDHGKTTLVRVRALRVSNRKANGGGPGKPLRGEPERGDWLLHPAPARATERLDLRLHLLPNASRKRVQGAGVTSGQAGAVAFIGRTLDPAWRTLTF